MGCLHRSCLNPPFRTDRPISRRAIPLNPSAIPAELYRKSAGFAPTCKSTPPSGSTDTLPAIEHLTDQRKWRAGSTTPARWANVSPIKRELRHPLHSKLALRYKLAHPNGEVKACLGRNDGGKRSFARPIGRRALRRAIAESNRTWLRSRPQARCTAVATRAGDRYTAWSSRPITDGSSSLFPVSATGGRATGGRVTGRSGGKAGAGR